MRYFILTRLACQGNYVPIEIRKIRYLVSPISQLKGAELSSPNSFEMKNLFFYILNIEVYFRSRQLSVLYLSWGLADVDAKSFPLV